MITINKNIQSEILMTTMEEIVPENSLFRKIDKYIDFTFIYALVKDKYCENNGRPSIDPVVLFKIVFIQAIEGIKSMRKTCERINTDVLHFIQTQHTRRQMLIKINIQIWL